MKKTDFQLEFGDRFSALRDPQREDDKRKIKEDWYEIKQAFTSAYKTSTEASQCCALGYTCRRTKETLDSIKHRNRSKQCQVYNTANKVKQDTRGKGEGETKNR